MLHSRQHYISHVKKCSNLAINIYITKGSFINTTCNENMDQLKIMRVNMVNANLL